MWTDRLRYRAAGYYVTMADGKGTATSDRFGTVSFVYNAEGKVSFPSTELPKTLVKTISRKIKEVSQKEKSISK